jgi:asparaginyl-tRNA synthetase
MTVAELKARAGDGDAVRVRGWVRTNRRGGRTGFITLSDGSCFSGCQIVYDAQEGGEQSAAARFHTGCAIEAEGVFTLTPGARQPFEVRARSVELVGGCDGDYPMQKKRHTLEFLREWPHLRVRTNTFQAMFRMRSILCAAIHEYFQNNGFIYVTTPIITGSDAEGAGEVFGVSGGDGGDFFGERAFLTVSGQLHAEPFALAFDKVYTFGPTFRAENSNTTVHASEFWMVEPEMAFCDLEDDMAVMEDMVKHCIRAVLKRAGEEVGFFSEFYGGGVPLADRLSSAAERAFARLTYTESIELLKKSGREFRFPVEWGADLKTEHER